jgi:hypothetical protein
MEVRGMRGESEMNIIRMAQQSGFGGQARITNLSRLNMFAALVAAAEREACARVAEAQENRVVVSHPARIEVDPNSMMARKIAAVIRTRSEK